MKKLLQLNHKGKQIRRAIKEEKKKLHIKLIKDNKLLFRLADIAMLLIILFNFGAIFLTNMMVAKETPDLILKEVNAIQSEIGNYELHPDADRLMRALMIQFVIWLFMLFSYIYYRLILWQDIHLIIFLTVVLFYVMATGFDFFNNFGYLIGKMIG